MNNYSKLYWLTRLDGIGDIIVGAGSFFLLAALCVLIYAFILQEYDWSEEENKAAKSAAVNRVRWFVPLGFLFLIISAFIPSKNEAILIMAGGKTLDFVGSDTSLNKLPAQTTAVISQYLDNALKEMKGK